MVRLEAKYCERRSSLLTPEFAAAFEAFLISSKASWVNVAFWDEVGIPLFRSVVGLLIIDLLKLTPVDVAC
jgi:hypothetical protein